MFVVMEMPLVVKAGIDTAVKAVVKSTWTPKIRMDKNLFKRMKTISKSKIL